MATTKETKANGDTKTVALTFTGGDLSLHERLAKMAEQDERSLNSFIVRELRKMHPPARAEE